MARILELSYLLGRLVSVLILIVLFIAYPEALAGSQ